MPNEQISGFSALAAAPAAGDLLAIVDVSDTTDAATGTTKKITTTDFFAGLPATGTPFELVVACSDEDTAIAAGTSKVTFRMPRAITLTGVRAHLKTPAATGTFTVDINEGGTTILSTKLTIDATEKTSVTATTPPVISDSALADDAEMTVDVDNDGDGAASGLKITLIGVRA